MQENIVKPKLRNFIHSLRDIGYTFEKIPYGTRACALGGHTHF